LVELIKNNNKLNYVCYNFIDSDGKIELKNLFDDLLKYENKDKINEYITKIEQMINTSNVFQQYVLK
jgi:uncharacterized Fe-S cluster-containing protein